jgi:hypothetical protein
MKIEVPEPAGTFLRELTTLLAVVNMKDESPQAPLDGLND